MPTRKKFGHVNGKDVHEVTIKGAQGHSARLITYGARLVDLFVPDRDGTPDDVVLGFDTLDEYLATDHYFGATCGRYGNRIARGRFMLDGTPHAVSTNEAGNHLHGGSQGFHQKIWMIADLTDSSAVFTAVSEDGEMGFPGRCDLKASYAFESGNQLSITMEAQTDRTTIMNMVHHSYFNLAGQGSGDVLDHEMQLNSGFYTPVDGELLATGEIASVKGTAFDFTKPKLIGQDIAALPSVVVGDLIGGGYDHNWCLGSAGETMRDVVDLYHPGSGRRMRLRSSEIGVQIYTGGYLTDQVKAKRGKRMCRCAGLTFETQRFPGSPNHAHFPSSVLVPGESYVHKMQLTFSTDRT